VSLTFSPLMSLPFLRRGGGDLLPFPSFTCVRYRAGFAPVYSGMELYPTHC